MSESAALIVPTLGESVTEATIARWLKSVGDEVALDESLVELETDKVTLEVNSPHAGTLLEIQANEGDTVGVGDVLGTVGEGEVKAPAPPSEPPKEEVKETPKEPEPEPELAPAPAPAPQPETPPTPINEPTLSPAAKKMVDEGKLDPDVIQPTGKAGRVTKEDVINFLEGTPSQPKRPSGPESAAPQTGVAPRPTGPREERVKMTRLRQTIAERLKQAQNTAAILTTFNEIDMSKVMEVRSKYKESFQDKHGVKLGFMSFFIKAAIVALKEIPEVNAEIHGDEIIYKNHYDIGVAVGTPSGLVVPVIRDADIKSFADIEKELSELAAKARDGKLTVEEMTGGTFTVSNGGVYGSLMSTPILNPPQSGILGMHKTQNRPIAVGDKIEIRPMMYLAFSYDHRIIDGREAVTFLVRIKDCIEDPERMLLDV